MSINLNITQSLPLSAPLEPPIRLRVGKGYFGTPRDNALGAGRFHTGVDLLAPEDTPVYTAYSGVVVDARRKCGDGIVRVLHQPASAAAYITVYAHLKTVDVSVNTFIEIGTVVGTVAPKTKNRPSHLHFELRHVMVDGLLSLSDDLRNKELRRLSRSIPTDPTRQIYHWEINNYKNKNGVDRFETHRQAIIQMADVVKKRIRYFRVRLKDGQDYFIPLVDPQVDELNMVESLRWAYMNDKAVTLAWRKSAFFDDHQVIAEVFV